MLTMAYTARGPVEAAAREAVQAAFRHAAALNAHALVAGVCTAANGDDFQSARVMPVVRCASSQACIGGVLPHLHAMRRRVGKLGNFKPKHGA